MDGRSFDEIARRLGRARSRRQVLGAAGMGTIGGLGAALFAHRSGSRLLAAEAPHHAHAQGAEEIMIEVEDFAFNPAAIEVEIGSTVTWTNIGEEPHTVTADDGSFDSGRLDAGGTFSHTFENVGAIAYHCELHPEMTATVTVIYIRRNAHLLDPEGPVLTAYATAVKEMKALSPTDPTSWLYQANIHGTPDPQPWLDLWSTCEHGTLFFWPWHRMYLYWFERIVRDVSGYTYFALPYWDYSDPARRTLPTVFRDSTSDLFEVDRNPNVNTPPPGFIPRESIFNHCRGLRQTDFTPASFGLESVPHDQVHGYVGGLMGGVRRSARDPIFWLHHSNLDRLWASWLNLGNTNLADPTWLAEDYEFFDEAGIKISPPQIVSTVLETIDLFYRYEALTDLTGCPVPPGPIEAGPGTPIATPEAPLELGSNAPEGGIEIGPDAAAVPITLDQPEAAGSAEAVVITIEGVEGGGVPTVIVEIYVNLPAGQTPEFDSPYYVGNLSLFGLQPWDGEGPHRMHKETQQFNIATNVRALEAIGEWTGDLDVTLVPFYTGASDPTEAGGGTPEALPAGPWVTVESISVTAQ